jgi:alpha-N-acetylglucosamine transferase
MLEKKAWVTLVTEKSYLKGFQVLARSLKRVQTVYPLIVLHPDTSIDTTTGQPKEKTSLTAEDLELIKKEGCELKAIERVHPINRTKKYIWEHYKDLWTKLRAWDFEDYDRVVFLDADMLVMRNIDNLMSMKLPKDFLAAANACTCNPMKNQDYPKDWQVNFSLISVKAEPIETTYHNCSHMIYNIYLIRIIGYRPIVHIQKVRLNQNLKLHHHLLS